MKNDVLKMFAQRAKRRLVGRENFVAPKIKIIPNEDENFKNKVEFLLSQDDLITNPVHYLVDDRELKSMNEEQKERYVLSTLDRYTSLKQEIENLQTLQRKVM